MTDRDGKPVTIEDAVRGGRIRISLDGQKLRGVYALTRIGSGKASRWLLVKKDDGDADAKTDVLRKAPKSVLSGRTLDKVVADIHPKSKRKRDVAA